MYTIPRLITLKRFRLIKEQSMDSKILDWIS